MRRRIEGGSADQSQQQQEGGNDQEIRIGGSWSRRRSLRRDHGRRAGRRHPEAWGILTFMIPADEPAFQAGQIGMAAIVCSQEILAPRCASTA
jgi:hypothetical protein